MEATHNLHVKALTPLVPPRILKDDLPMTERSNKTVVDGRNLVQAILKREDPRFLVVVGPCSIHDPKAALEYAERLARLRREFEDRICILMRVYFEKPRTTIGWKGLINDPHLDGSSDIQAGLRIARKLLLDITSLGLPAGTEFLDPITPQYIADLVSWAAIGARTTESQTHREMASGLSMPVGFKNSTDGTIQVALDAMESSRNPHSFLGIDQEGRTCIVQTTGNKFNHIVLRGGRTQTNYDPESIRASVDKLKKSGVTPNIMVDCSHANSGKKHERQEFVWQNILEQRIQGNEDLVGAMIESNLFSGNQPFPRPVSELKHGISITDECVDWETTERMLRHGYETLAGRKQKAAKT
jgi:3-deoxy-7-phosphoheptulonate synthase